ncbi:MAG TPA: hypothetical protein VKA18_09835 [Alphaproteobacteria bacterium]|nr:hypothetical protein [Alphaproteobacteria bacterium]
MLRFLPRFAATLALTFLAAGPALAAADNAPAAGPTGYVTAQLNEDRSPVPMHVATAALHTARHPIDNNRSASPLPRSSWLIILALAILVGFTQRHKFLIHR